MEKLKLHTVIVRLDYYNKWRRDNTGKLTMPNVTELGITIDRAIELLKGMEIEVKLEAKRKSPNNFKSVH